MTHDLKTTLDAIMADFGNILCIGADSRKKWLRERIAGHINAHVSAELVAMQNSEAAKSEAA